MSVPFSTASLHLDIISALYGSAVKKSLLPPTDLFSRLKAQLKALGPDGWKSGIDDEIFARALRLTRNASLLISDDAIAADLVLLSLTRSLQPLESLALLKKEDLDPNVGTHGSCVRVPSSASSAPPAPLRDIIARHRGNARRKYIFPLDQSRRTEAQLKRHIAKIVNALFRRVRLPQSTDPNQTVEALWAYAALRTGIPASSVVSYLGHAPLGLPILKLCTPNVGTHGSCVRVPSRECAAGLSSGETNAALSSYNLQLTTYNFAAIGRVFLDNPPRWYAMSLRPGVRFTQVCRRIQLLTSPNSNSHNLQLKTYNSAPTELFYPCEEIARAIGKKIVIKQRPFIHSVVFFKAKLTDIGPLFARIGDLAWCYRQSAAAGAPYAEISETQFRLFQQTIARFTPDYEVASAGELELQPNDRVEIVGGLFAGREATVVGTHGSKCGKRPPDASPREIGNHGQSRSEDSRLKTEDSPTVYRLNIIGDNGIEWRIHVDSRLAHLKN